MGTGAEYAQYEHRVRRGSAFAATYTPATLPGFGATVSDLQTHASAAVDWRRADGYARRGGFLGVTARRVDDTGDGPYSFRQVDYEAVQHVPVLRDAWVLSLRGRVETTATGRGHELPFVLLPTLGNGAVDHRLASPPRHYLAAWHLFDNATGTSTLIGETTGESATIAAPRSLPTGDGAFVRVAISATHPDHPSWQRPVQTYFRREPSGWRLVGLERLPDQ